MPNKRHRETTSVAYQLREQSHRAQREEQLTIRQARNGRIPRVERRAPWLSRELAWHATPLQTPRGTTAITAKATEAPRESSRACVEILPPRKRRPLGDTSTSSLSQPRSVEGAVRATHPLPRHRPGRGERREPRSPSRRRQAEE